jgi:Kef-type K+ transport system membrane component KefB
VLGLVILSVVSGMASGAAVTIVGVARTLGVAAGFLVVAVVAGRFLLPKLFDVVVRMQVRYVLLVFAFAFALGLAATAAVAGSALIIGAFAAGLILSGTNQFDIIEHEVKPVASIFTPIFFVSIGASVDLRLLDPTNPDAGGTLGIAGVLIVLAILGKIAAGWAAPWTSYRRLVVGVGMIPRGEVGLIFADIGRRAGILTQEVFGAVLIMVMATTFVAPPALKALFGSKTGADE